MEPFDSLGKEYSMPYYALLWFCEERRFLAGREAPAFCALDWYSAATLLYPALLSELRLAKLQKKNDKVKCYFYFLEEKREGEGQLSYVHNFKVVMTS